MSNKKINLGEQILAGLDLDQMELVSRHVGMLLNELSTPEGVAKTRSSGIVAVSQMMLPHVNKMSDQLQLAIERRDFQANVDIQQVFMGVVKNKNRSH